MKLRIIHLLLIAFVSFQTLAQVDRTKAPEAQPNPGINIPKPEVFELENGLKVIVVEYHKQPIISYQLYVDHQPNLEGNKAGLNDLFGQLLGSGTEKLSKDQFDETVDFMGASFYPNSRGYFASALSKQAEPLIELMSQVTLSPSFPEEEFDRIKNQQISELSTIATDPSSMASNVAGVVNYGENHPYGEVVTEKSLENISVDDIKAHYETYFKPNFSYLVVVGDIQAEKAKELANKYFGQWEKGEEPKANYTEIPQTEGQHVYFVDKPGAVQSVIKITQAVDIKPGNPDEIKLKVFNAILGGGSFSARLMANLREDKAYTYGCYSSVRADEITGSFNAGGSFRNTVTDSAVTQIMYEINRIYNEPVTKEEISLVKSSMTGAFARSLENPQTVARFALNTIRYNLPDDYYATYLQKLEQVTIEDVLTAGKKYLNPENLNIIIVGNSKIAEKLNEFDVNHKITFKDAYGNDISPLKEVEDGVSVESILNKYLLKVFMVDDIEAAKAKAEKIGYIKMTSVTHIKQAGMDVTLTAKSFMAKPYLTASITKMKDNGSGQEYITSKEWFDGESGGTFVMMQGSTQLNEDEIAERSFNSFPISQMYYLSDENYQVELLGIETVNDKEYFKLKVNTKNSEDFTFEYYNVETGMLDITENFTTDPEGNPATTKIVKNEYQVYGKGKYTLMFASTYDLFMQGQAMKFENTEITISKKGNMDVFKGEF